MPVIRDILWLIKLGEDECVDTKWYIEICIIVFLLCFFSSIFWGFMPYCVFSSTSCFLKLISKHWFEIITIGLALFVASMFSPVDLIVVVIDLF